MTLNPYRPQDLDELALRLLDLAAIFRDMSRRARDQELPTLALNDKKAQEWISKLEHWAVRAHTDLEGKIRIERATRRAQSVGQ
jgi:hypothetical protein